MKLGKSIRFMQEGGMTPAPEAAPAPAAPEAAPAPEAGAQEQMMAQIDLMAESVIQQIGPEAAAMLAEAIMAKLQGGEQLPPQEEQPVYSRMGGSIKRIR